MASKLRIERDFYEFIPIHHFAMFSDLTILIKTLFSNLNSLFNPQKFKKSFIFKTTLKEDFSRSGLLLEKVHLKS